jgi:hypothetical protein
MSQFEKLLFKLLGGKSDNNFIFDEICNLLKRLEFESRVKGSHFIFYKKGIDEIINIQNLNGKAKPYQVKQIRNLIIKYKL